MRRPIENWPLATPEADWLFAAFSRVYQDDAVLVAEAYALATDDRRERAVLEVLVGRLLGAAPRPVDSSKS